jgi:hypothetical protein
VWSRKFADAALSPILRHASPGLGKPSPTTVRLAGHAGCAAAAAGAADLSVACWQPDKARAVAVEIKTVWIIVRMIVILDSKCYGMWRNAGLARLPWTLDVLTAAVAVVARFLSQSMVAK